MHQLRKGDVINVPVQVTGGAFAGECLITFNTIEGPVSGFINSREVQSQGDVKVIPAVVLAVESDRIAVRFNGSFFTTTGLAHISSATEYERAA